MLNDIKLFSNDNKVQTGLVQAKGIFRSQTAYSLSKSALDRNTTVVIFGDHFIYTMRLVLSEPDGGCILQFSPEEEEVYFAYVDYMNGDDPTDPEMLLVVTELDKCIMDELQCKTGTYVDRCFNLDHSWEDCDGADSNMSYTLTQGEYDTLGWRLNRSAVYTITEDSVPVRVYQGITLIGEL